MEKVSPASQPPSLYELFNPFILNPFQFVQETVEYCLDAWQRQILFIDTLRQRSNAHLERRHDKAPSVLHFDYEIILDGHYLPKPVNYQLLKILPPSDVMTDDLKRPFIVFDPRAGHGPGIGGMKHDSEIGSTLRAGHPCYFVGFTTEPVDGQTVEDVSEAEAVFVAKVIELHQKAEKPCLIGNCQAGWQITMMGSLYPELVGVLILAGAPMSYWAGVRGKNPMRYNGGLCGGSWTTSLASDLGNGRYDGAMLVENFEKLNPANTYWKKAYNLYSKIDTEATRFLQFEKWWGHPILLNGEEMKFIVNELFIGNNFSRAKIHTSEGLRIDIRNVKTPIVCFCSMADDITPPQQALGWILDLYRDDKEILAAGQTIIYCLHQNIGHLGIFVSSSVASKEHDKFIQNIDLIETLPPGLYEAVFLEKDERTAHADLASGDYVLRFEARTLDSIRELGINDVDDERRFETVRHVSDSMRGLYETFASPVIRSLSTEQSAELIRAINPIRLRYAMLSDRDPCLAGIDMLAEQVRKDRRPVAESNIWWRLQSLISKQIIANLESYRELRDNATERFFLDVYGSLILQSALGLRTAHPYSKNAVGRDLDRERGIHKRIHGLMELSTVGGLSEALVRALLYIVRGGNGFDEREFNMLRRLCQNNKILPSMTQSEFKALVRQQHAMLVLDEKASMEAIPKLLDRTTLEAETEALETIKTVIKAHGRLTLEEERRLRQLEKYFVSEHTSFHRRASDVQVFGE